MQGAGFRVWGVSKGGCHPVEIEVDKRRTLPGATATSP